MRGSQNGLDNSGTTGNMEWTYTVSEGGAAKYLHWDIRGQYSSTNFVKSVPLPQCNSSLLFFSMKGGEWIGHYNQTTKQYSSINGTNLEHSMKVVQLLVDRHKSDPIIVGLEPRKY